jgi:hypothetical protein
MQTPFAKYDCSFNLTSPRAFEKKIHKPTASKGWKIEKMDGPGPGSYNSALAHDYSLKPKLIGPIKASSPRGTFTDGFAKLHKEKPGMGTYDLNDIDKGFKLTAQGTFNTLSNK